MNPEAVSILPQTASHTERGIHMAKTGTVAIYLRGEIDNELRQRGDNRSGTVNRDLERLYTLYKHALQEVDLSTDEACLICDVLNGTWTDVTSARYLAAEVADGIKLNALDQKWEVDGKALVGKLDALDRLHALALVDAAERFWAVPPTKDGREVAAQVFGIRGERGNNVVELRRRDD